MLAQISGRTSDNALVFSFVAPQGTRLAWSVILPGVQQIKEKNHEPWMCEDIYASLVAGKASLYMFHDEHGAYAGFAVFEPILFSPFDTAPSLNIWLGYAVDKGRGKDGIEVAKQVAAQSNIERIVFSTPQDGWSDRFRRITSWYEV